MNLFESARVYPDGWTPVSERPFSQEEKDLVTHAEVVESQYGNSICFFMKSGGKSYIPLSPYSSLVLGDVVNLDSISIVTLEREGKQIYRIL